MTIDDYIDAAIQRGRFPSESRLAAHLGLSRQTVSHWRTKRAWPSERVMLDLADLAGLDRAQALLDLNQWRVEEGPARQVYAQIAERLKKAATIAGAAMIASLLYEPSGTKAAQSAVDNSTTIHYARRRLLAWLAPQGFTACS